MFRVENPLSTFIHVPKTGGKSINQWMLGLDNISEKHKNRDKLKLEYKKYGNHGHLTRDIIESNYGPLGRVFCVVRNPYDRMVSGWLFNSSSLTFEQFIKNKSHWKNITLPYSKYVKDSDTIMRYENLQEDFKLMQDFYNNYRPLPYINKTNSRTSRDYKSYYTDRLVDMVYEQCKEDIDRFNYVFEE